MDIGTYNDEVEIKKIYIIRDMIEQLVRRWNMLAPKGSETQTL